MDHQFIQALEERDLQTIQAVPKSDLHNHSALGGRLDYIERALGVDIPRPGPQFKTFGGFTDWIDDHFVPVLEGPNGLVTVLEAAFCQARDDGVVRLEMSLDASWPSFFGGSVMEIISIINTVQSRCAPEIDFRPVLGLDRNKPVEKLMEGFKVFLDYDFLCSMDIYGDEFAQPIGNLKPIYKLAKEKGLGLKAHVGEYGDADSIREAVEELELDQVQHGISAADSPEVMKWLSDNRIQLNVCPTSNVMLCRTENMKTHPIKILHDHGVKVTVNTDDVIVFNQGVSEEFLNLYDAGLFTAIELNEIRLNGF